jgi:serine/threonine protein kinase
VYERVPAGQSQAGEAVFEFADESEPLLALGERGHASDNRDWLWTFRGRCRIYVTAYHPGQHVAWSPLDFIPVVDHLLQLHRMNLVHGDIRCSNIVFHGPESGCLIDFDFGGEVNLANGTPKYPSGFNFVLRDGLRRGIVGGRITLRDDWYALKGVVFTLHEFRPPKIAVEVEDEPRLPWWKRRWRQVFQRRARTGEEGTMRALISEKLVRDKMTTFIDFADGSCPDNLAEIEVHAELLMDALRAAAASSWTVTPQAEMRNMMALWGLDVERPLLAPLENTTVRNAAEPRNPRTLSLPATGSPPPRTTCRRWCDSGRRSNQSQSDSLRFCYKIVVRF